MFLFFISQLFAGPIIDDTARANTSKLLYSANENSPFGRLQIALAAVEAQSDPNTLLALSNSHPHIAIMALDSEQEELLKYLLVIPSTEKHKLRQENGIIRSIDEMNKTEKKRALELAKTLGISKKLTDIRIDSFDGITIAFEFAYKDRSEMKRKTITLAQPYAPVITRESRNDIEKILGKRPLPPLDGKYAVLPISSGSFEEGLRTWNKTKGFSFEATEPPGVVGIDDESGMDGDSSLRFYNTERTRVFHEVSQSVPLSDEIEIRVQCFNKSKNTRIEYRQEASFTRMNLVYKDASGTDVRTETKDIRLGSYDWEQFSSNSYVPQGASSVEISFLSSVSGTLWVDGLTVTQLQ
jgi:hypothetical protein